MHWDDTRGEFTSGEGNFVFSSGNRGHTEVEIVVDKKYRNLC